MPTILSPSPEEGTSPPPAQPSSGREGPRTLAPQPWCHQLERYAPQLVTGREEGERKREAARIGGRGEDEKIGRKIDEEMMVRSIGEILDHQNHHQ